MFNDPLAICRELAKQFKGRTSSINLYDGNVCAWTHPSGRTWESVLLSGEPFLRQLRYSHRGHRIRIFANHRFLNVEVMGSFAIQHLSINQKNANNPLLKGADTLTIDGKQYSCFTEPGTLSSDHKNLFAKTEFTVLMRELGLQTQESIHFAEDSISVYLDQPPLRRVTNAVEGLIGLAESIARHPEELDLRILPVRFHPLIPLINKWAIGDDADREDFLETLPRSALESFASEVEPYLRSIDSYLDSFGSQPPSQEATALGRLAECAVEAKQYLKSNQREK